MTGGFRKLMRAQCVGMLALGWAAWSAASVQADDAVRLTKEDGKVVVKLGDQPFCEYRYAGYAKPILFPIYGPHQTEMTRRWPIEDPIVPEADDHPHHKSLWFTHGNVNGVDFWAEGEKSGKIVHTELAAAEGGDAGRLVAKAEWRAPDGEVVCTETSMFEFADTPHGRAIDVEITLHASHGEVKLGDTKEGTLGVRTHPQLRLDPDKKRGVESVSGRAVNSNGEKDKAIWGKRAEWVDYWGEVDGRTVGIAIMDHPQNLRHPTWWHARNYGLVAANPFGRQDFEGKSAESGDHVIPAGESLTLRYRFLFHEGDAEKAQIAEAYKAYAGK